ncbi:hypothetical protein SK128_010084 [Halocaridina rubra]|uniref:Adenosine deaminase n=1 Tax=Halocaridina rubra TaxID=373956 RepID=A0AAN8XLD9_HALRR
MRQKGHKLPGNGSLGDFKNAMKVKEPVDLCNFLKGFEIFFPSLIGDLAVIERFSYEFVEDLASDSVAYCEARFCPHLLLPQKSLDLFSSKYVNGNDEETCNGNSTQIGEKLMKSDDILKAVLKGIKRGEEEYGTKVRIILCCIRGCSQWAWDILRLCEEYHDQGVVGIDIAGDKGIRGIESNDDTEIAVFAAAKEKGIHRTAHAGEAGPASTVKEAVEVLGAERIGHGYHVLEDDAIYNLCRQEDIHFEVCPHSSYDTGAILALKTKSKRHPVLRFAEDDVSFSINTDDPTLTLTKLTDEYNLLSQWGFTEAHFTRANFQAALHSFLSADEKKMLIDQLREAYSIVEYAVPTTASATSPLHEAPLKPSVTFGTWAERT